MATQDTLNNTLADQTGTGKYAGDTSPTFVTPVFGAATGTSVNLGSSTTITGMIDDDTFATASSSLAASSESIKAYTDSMTGGSGGVLGVQVLTASSGTYTPTSGTNKVIVEAISGGGGGGGASVNNFVGAGGAGGGYAKVYIAVTPIASQSYTVGASGSGGVGAANGATGGQTTFGSYITCNGGVGGNANGTGAITVGGTSSTAGVTATLVSARGGAGNLSGTIVANRPNGGYGASSPLGSGGEIGPSGGNGVTAHGPGAGGGGGYRNATVSRNGGAGAAGIIIVYEYS